MRFTFACGRRRFVFCEDMATSANLGAAVGPASVPVGQVSYSLSGIAARPAKNLSLSRVGHPLAEALPLVTHRGRACVAWEHGRSGAVQVRRCGTTARACAATCTNMCACVVLAS